MGTWYSRMGTKMESAAGKYTFVWLPACGKSHANAFSRLHSATADSVRMGLRTWRPNG